MGHCYISFQHDGELCIHLVRKGYTPRVGARGLRRQARNVEIAARQVYNAIPDRVDESLNEGLLERLEVKLTPKGAGKHGVGFVRKRDE